MRENSEWQERSKTLEDGKIVRWLERDLGGGTVERRYLDELKRSFESQPVNVSAA